MGGASTLPILGLIEFHGPNLKAQMAANVGNANDAHLWNTLGGFKDGPMGVHCVVFGLDLSSFGTGRRILLWFTMY